jgi:hypothetical protein
MGFRRNFKKTVLGYIEVKDAMNTNDAEREFEDGDYDEFDNKSQYEYGEWELV